MLGFREYLKERIKSIGLNPKHDHYREKLRGQIHDVLRKSYADVDGGYGGHGAGSDAESKAIHADISDAAHIKTTLRNGKVTHATLYKKQRGRKLIGTGTDGSKQGSADFRKNQSDDHKMKRAWGEFSGKAENSYRKAGYPQVPASRAAELTGKEVKVKDENRYSRKIGGHDHEKSILGHPK